MVDITKCCQQSTNDCRMLFTLGVQLCVQRSGRLGATGCVARVCLHQLILRFIISIDLFVGSRRSALSDPAVLR